MTKIALIGYGTMGKAIERIASAPDFMVTNVFDIDNPVTIRKDYDFDIAIDFSTPDAVAYNAEIVAKSGKNLVIGTTGWTEQFDYINDLANQYNIGIVYGSNFSLGMQLFFRITEFATKLFSKFPEYDVALHEIHHNRKLDVPSGTALTLGEIVTKNHARKYDILTGNPIKKIAEHVLHISATRVGDTPGTHTLYFDSAPDTIELTHRARNREGFARGALLAAKLIKARNGVFDFSELLDEYLEL